MLNARNQKSPVDIAKIARSQLGKRIVAVVEEYEDYMTKQRGTHRYVAVRTRQAILRNGAEGAVRNAVMARPSPGFKELIKIGKPELTYEWVALEFPVFKRIHERAAARLAANGVRNYPGYEKKPAVRRARSGGVGGLTAAAPTA